MKNINFIKTPLKKLTHGNISSSGRNHTGQITSWHRGGKHPRLYRKIDFYRQDTHGLVIGLEYDPNRKAFLARIFNPDTCVHNYILAPAKLNVGDVIRSDSEHSSNGHSQKLRYVPTGSSIFNVATKPGKAGKLLRAPGSFGILIKKTTSKAQVCLKSGRKCWFNLDTLATFGIVSNQNNKFKKLKKAGESRWLGKRPAVRGVAMNPIDHPHGGGEGKTSGGRPSVTPWGKPAKRNSHR